MAEAKTGQAGRTGGKLLADALVAQGVTHAFCVPGESYLDLLDGLYSVRNRLQLVTCRFEAGAIHMAEAYGKLTGKPGVAIVTRGPGACHAAIGVHVAQQDSTPLVLLVGQIPVGETDRETFQEVDYRRMFSPIAKWVTPCATSASAKSLPPVRPVFASAITASPMIRNHGEASAEHPGVKSPQPKRRRVIPPPDGRGWRRGAFPNPQAWQQWHR